MCAYQHLYQIRDTPVYASYARTYTQSNYEHFLLADDSFVRKRGWGAVCMCTVCLCVCRVEWSLATLKNGCWIVVVGGKKIVVYCLRFRHFLKMNESFRGYFVYVCVCRRSRTHKTLFTCLISLTCENQLDNNK